MAVDCALAAGVAALFTRPEAPGLLSALVFFLSYTFFTGLFGQTPGMWLWRLRCVRYPSQGRLGLGRAILRTLALQLVVPALFLDRAGRGLHDRWTDSIVLRTF